MTKTKRVITLILCLALCFTVGGELFAALTVTAKAETVEYSNVLDDLEKDSSFNPDNYPAIDNDYSLQVIQIAEGENGELFLYVYQPSGNVKDYRAKRISMSLQAPTDTSIVYDLYSVTLLNTDGLFQKYVVNDFTVTSDVNRYYNILTVYRLYDEYVDDLGAVDTKQEVGYEVGKTWRAYYYNNILIYECCKLDVVDIDILASGTIRYTEGFKFIPESCDSHYVAFEITNYNVDRIIDADITFITRSVSWKYILNLDTMKYEDVTTYGDPLRQFITLTDIDTGSNNGDGFLGVKYTWDRIQTVDSFISEVTDHANEQFPDSELAALKKCDFVFRFYESPYLSSNNPNYPWINSTEVFSFGILRLHFLSEGKTYNLGVVSDLVGTDNIPELNVSISDNFENEDWWLKIMMILGLIVLLIIISYLPVIFVIFRIIFSAISFLFSIVWGILSLPFKILKALFDG